MGRIINSNMGVTSSANEKSPLRDSYEAYMRHAFGLSQKTSVLGLPQKTTINSGFPEQGGGSANAEAECQSEGGGNGGEAPAVGASDDGDSGDGDGEPARQSILKSIRQTDSAGKRTLVTHKRCDSAVNKMTKFPPISATRPLSNQSDTEPTDELGVARALLTFSFLSNYTSLGRSRIYQLIADPAFKFPPPLKIGKSSRWLRSEVDSWLAKQASSRQQVAG